MSSKGVTGFKLFLNPISAGFPSPATDLIDKQLDLHELLIKHPTSTFFTKVSGDSMKNAGILSGDILVVDKSIEPKSFDIVVAALNGEFTVKRLKKLRGKVFLVPENNDYEIIEIQEEDDFLVWGVVVSVIRKYQ